MTSTAWPMATSRPEVPAQDIVAWADLLTFGVLSLAPTGQVSTTNRAARSMLKRSDGLLVRGRRLSAVAPTDDDALQGLVFAALRGSAARQAVAIERPSGWRAYQVVARHVPDGAVLFVTDPAADLPRVKCCLQHLYGLTDAEAEVAAGVADGRDTRQIAANRSCAVETVRSLLKRVFAKTGVTRQPDLIRVAMSCAPGLGPKVWGQLAPAGLAELE